MLLQSIGSKKDSRIEYGSMPESIQGSFKFSLQFKTFSGEGVIFYASSISHTNFFAIYMQDGKVRIQNEYFGACLMTI